MQSAATDSVTCPSGQRYEYPVYSEAGGQRYEYPVYSEADGSAMWAMCGGKN
jgi:hypothetical protein